MTWQEIATVAGISGFFSSCAAWCLVWTVDRKDRW